MKTLIIIALIAFATSANAATVNLGWKANAANQQVTGYNVYVDGVKATTVAGITASVTVTPGAHSIYVTAVNVWQESPPSNTVTTPPAATAPQNVVITGTLTIIAP